MAAPWPFRGEQLLVAPIVEECSLTNDKCKCGHFRKTQLLPQMSI